MYSRTLLFSTELIPPYTSTSTSTTSGSTSSTPRSTRAPLVARVILCLSTLDGILNSLGKTKEKIQTSEKNSTKTTQRKQFIQISQLLFTLHVTNAHSWTCMDLYVFATPFRVTWDYYFLSLEHTLEFDEWESKAEYDYVKRKGVAIFLMEAGMLGTLSAFWKVFSLFTNTAWGESSNIAFLEKNMGAKFEQRPQPWVTNISSEDIHSGDFLALSKIRGRWGAFESLEKWVSGSYAGHSAVCLRDSEGKLWVAESGHENEVVAFSSVFQITCHCIVTKQFIVCWIK
ncbi:hypothetical protein LIER_35859 [Lithospermum erythrorhizon]|uniref:Uncharacterized protein n=1 Tax=Lithospermum erythrorhizon TaxID=34254 RepID=A0AAV3NX91_LITER